MGGPGYRLRRVPALERLGDAGLGCAVGRIVSAEPVPAQCWDLADTRLDELPLLLEYQSKRPGRWSGLTRASFVT